jgi:hypothetical protein
MTHYAVVGGPFPFTAQRGASAAVNGRPRSTSEGLDGVSFANFDLAGRLAYRGHEYARVFLARKRALIAGRRCECILVFGAAQHAIEDAAKLGLAEAMGILRPVQRYVRLAGLERAAALDGDVIGRMQDEDRWGFVLVSRDSGPAVAVTPPVLEQLGAAERDSRLPAELSQLILCDGTHRVVQIVWRSRRALAAVAVLGEPDEPYYAHPQPAWGWRETSSRRLRREPSPERKYRVREVDLDALPPGQRARFDGVPEPLRYRRYFRELATGFGFIGGQGGREAPAPPQGNAGRR